MKAPNLISPNDYKRIEKAFNNLQPDDLFRTMGDYAITIKVKPTGKSMSAWNQPMVIQVTQEYRNIYKLKNCKDINELRWYLSA